jgi:hypothetical protein
MQDSLASIQRKWQGATRWCYPTDKGYERIVQRLHVSIAMTSGHEGQALVDLLPVVRGLDHPSRFHLLHPALLAIATQDHGPLAHYDHSAQQEFVSTTDPRQVAVCQYNIRG